MTYGTIFTMGLTPLSVLNDHEYHAEVIRKVRATKAGDRVALMTMSFDPLEEIVAALMQELIAAAKRQVRVTLNVDAHCFMMHDMTALPTGPLYTHPNSVPRKRRGFSTKLLILDALRDSGGSYRITNIPERPLSNPFSGRSHIKFTVINDTAYVGGCNLSKTWGLDLMVRLKDKKTVEWIYDFMISVEQKGNPVAVLDGKDIRVPIDKDTVLLVDAGRKRQSLIYTEALSLIDQAKEWIVLTCQFFPGRATAEHVAAARARGVKVTLYFNPTSTRAKVQRLAFWFAERQERNKYPAELFQHQLPPGLPHLHAKLLATEQAAIIGSHNYVVQGVAFGTAEAAILRKDPQFSKKAAEVFTKRLAEAKAISSTSQASQS